MDAIRENVFINDRQARRSACQARYLARAGRARRWARVLMVLMLAAFLAAVWQTRAVAPPVHDAMHATAGDVRYWLDHTDELRGWIRQTFSGSSGTTSVQAAYDPITSWLLKWTN